MSIESINLWHSRARPTPDAAQFNVQLGCHLEEIVEMLGTFELTRGGGSTIQDVLEGLSWIAENLKANEISATITNRKEFLDAIADQVVTGVGAAYCAGMNAPEAVRRVNSSNWSKVVDGEFVYDADGKIIKPPTYQPPNLEGLY